MIRPLACSRRGFFRHAGAVALAGAGLPARGEDEPKVPTVLEALRRKAGRAPGAMKSAAKTGAAAGKGRPAFGKKPPRLPAPHRPRKVGKTPARGAKDLDAP